MYYYWSLLRLCNIATRIYAYIISPYKYVIQGVDFRLNKLKVLTNP